MGVSTVWLTRCARQPLRCHFVTPEPRVSAAVRHLGSGTVEHDVQAGATYVLWIDSDVVAMRVLCHQQVVAYEVTLFALAAVL